MLSFIFSLFCGKEKRILNLYIVLSFLSPLMDIFSFSMVLVIMNKVLAAGGASEKLIVFTFIMALFSLFKSIFEIYKNYVSNQVVYDGARSISVKVYDLLMNEDLMHHNEKTPMQALSVVKEDTSACIGIFVKIIGVIVSAVTTMGYSVTLVWYGGIAGILILIPLVGFMVLIYFANRRHIRIYGEKKRQLAIRTNAQVTTAYGAFKEMKIDNRADYLLERYDSTSVELTEIQKRYSLRSSVSGVLMREAVMIFLFLFLGFFMMYQENLVEMMASMIIYIGILIKMVPIMYGIVAKLNGIDYARKSYDVLKDCMERYSIFKKVREEESGMRKKEVTFNQGLRVEGLTFGYTPEKKIFENAAIVIPAGSSVAIIGASGSGKTTFLDLILGLHKAESGKVYYDDYELVSRSDKDGPCLASLGDIVSYIPQVVYLNGETIKHNVAFFEEDETINDERIIECLKTARIWDDVAEMKDGINTEIGANGTTISGGQRQRIALARALYKEFEILVMDEATAALDMETEKAVIDSIRQVKGDKTLLMVTHHMSLANECDIVYRIANMGFVRER